MPTFGMPELIILIAVFVMYVVIPIAVLALARGLIRYGREQARREFEAKAATAPTPDRPVDPDRHDATG